MRAAVCRAYGPPEVVELTEVPDPVPGARDVLVRTIATTVSSGDARVRRADFPPGFALPARLALGVTRPRKPILGIELAGIVERVGPDVTRFRPGDEVVAFSGFTFGCHAELKVVAETAAIVAKPRTLSFAEAAAVSFGGTTALYFLRDAAKVAPGERVLVNGATGSVGAAAVQLARHLGAHVTAVCSAESAHVARALGANEALDYRAADFARLGERWDIIVDTVGNASLARCRQALSANGRLALVVAGLGATLAAPLASRRNGHRVIAGVAPERAADVAFLLDLAARGIARPPIDSRHALDAIVAAHARVDTARKRGAVIVEVGPG